METKKCARCDLEKDISEFYKKENSKSGYRSYCKQCNSELHQEYCKKDYLKVLLNACYARCKTRKIICDSVDNLYEYLKPIYDTGICQKCGRILIKATGKQKDDSPSMDRLIPELGYVVGNVTFLCYDCNRRKADNTYEQFKEWIEWYDEQFLLPEHNQIKDLLNIK